MFKKYLNFRENHPRLANLIDWIVYPALIFILIAIANYLIPVPKDAEITSYEYNVRFIPFIINIVGILFFYAPGTGFGYFVTEKQGRRVFLHDFFLIC